MKRFLAFIFCMFLATASYADVYNLQSTASTGDTIEASDRNTEFQAIQTVLNGNLTGPDNIKDGSIRDIDINASYPIGLNKLSGSSTTETIRDVISNTAANDFKGWKQGLTLERSGTTKLIINAGTIAIGNNLYQNTGTTSVTIATAWSASTTTGGKDSGTTYNDGDLIYVFACVTTGDVDGIAFNLSENASPTDVTVGTNARVIGAFEYDTTNGVQQIVQYFDWGVSGWNFIVGDGSGAADGSNITHGVTFVHPPHITAIVIGDKATTTQPTDPTIFNGNGERTIAVSATTTTNFDISVWVSNGGNTSASNNYGYSYIAIGQWTL